MAIPTSSLKIVCDKNMPLALEAFSTLGTVLQKDGRQFTAADVKDADLLMCRSTTKVNAALLDGSRVRFIGSAVIGTDHLDFPYLAQRSIPVATAPGCNAESVANYLTAALLVMARDGHFTLAGKRIGVVGVGNVGRRVCRCAKALGLEVLACDPPRRRNPADAEAQTFISLEELLPQVDFVTVHVPLTRTGEDATFHLLDEPHLAMMKPGARLIDAARGPVIDTDAVLRRLGHGIAEAVIDCWEGEPRFRLDLAARVKLGTPHIAGHSYEGKVNGTAQVYRAACAFLGREPTFDFSLPPPPFPEIAIDVRACEEDCLRAAVLTVYDIEADFARFKTACLPDDETRAKAFDALRKHYPMRREFHATRLRFTHGEPGERLAAAFRGLGFQF